MFSRGTMKKCDFFDPREPEKDHWQAFSEKRIMYDPTRYLVGYCINHSPGDREKPDLVVVPRHWVAVAKHIL